MKLGKPLRMSMTVALACCLMALAAPLAKATIFTGNCALNLTFSFDRPIKAAALSQGRNVGYEIAVSPAADLSPLDGGSQPCVVDTSATDPFRSTSGSGAGQSIAWTCEAAVGTGSWEQEWDPDPAPVSGAHSITGPWGKWTMVVNNASLSFTGTMNLTVAATDAAKLSQCAGTGFTTLRMTGIFHFQDPEV